VHRQRTKPGGRGLRRSEAGGAPDIVVNSSFRAAAWADALYALDAAWWKVNRADIEAQFAGIKVGGSLRCRTNGAEIVTNLRRRGNSGAGAIALAAYMGAAVIVLLGYDCQRSGGRAHWHPDHPAPLGNAGGIAGWPRQFGLLASMLQIRNVRVVNCSRETALRCFERGELSDFVDS
jgi:hypothetical protein